MTGKQFDSGAFAAEYARTARLCAELDAASRAFRAAVDRLREDDFLMARALRRARAIVGLCEAIQTKRSRLRRPR